MRSAFKKALAAVLFAAAGIAPSAAQGPEIFGDLMESCRSDYHRFCEGVAPGGGRIAHCLGLNKYELSPGCYKAFTVGAAIKACTADYHRLCPGVPPGEGRALQCLGEQREDVSEHCDIAITEALTEHRNAPTAAYGYRDDRDARDEDADEGRDYSDRYEDKRFADKDGYGKPNGGHYSRDVPKESYRSERERGSYERGDDYEPDVLK